MFQFLPKSRLLSTVLCVTILSLVVSYFLLSSRVSQVTLEVSQGTLGLSQGTLELSQGTLGLSQGTLELSQGTLGLSQGTLELSQGTLGLSQGNLGLSQGTLGLSQGTLGLSQGTLGLSQGTLGFSQGTLDTSRQFSSHMFSLTGEDWDSLSNSRLLCLATETSLDRLQLVLELATTWSGPLSVAVFVPRDQVVLVRHVFHYIRSDVASFTTGCRGLRPLSVCCLKSFLKLFQFNCNF